MAKRDMDLYHSRLTQDNLTKLIIKYKIHRDLHPRLPSEDFVMSKLPDDAIGVYHRIFDFLVFVFLLFLTSRPYQALHGSFYSARSLRLFVNKGIGFPLLSVMLRPQFALTIIRHPDLAIDDPKPIAGSYRMADVCRLSAHVVKLKDMPEGGVALVRLESFMGIHDFLCFPEWTGAEVQEEPHHDIRPSLQRLPFYYTPDAAVVSDPTPEELAVRNPSAKAEASQKRKAYTCVSASGHVAKRTRSDVANPPVVPPVPICLLMIMSGGFAAPVAEGLTTQGSRGKGVMTDVDAVATLFVVASPPWVSSGPVPSFKELSGDAIHIDFFCFSPRPYYATYPKGGFLCLQGCGGSISDTRSHHEYEQSTDSTLKGYHEKFTSLIGLESQVSALQRQITGLNDKLSTSDASFAKSKAKGKERKKKIKSLTKSLDNLHAEVARLSIGLYWATVLEVAQTDYAFLNKISEHAVEPLSVILQLEPKKLASPANVPASKDACVSPSITKESTMTLASTSLKLLSNIVPTSSATALETNKEWVNAMVDGPDNEMVDAAANAKPGDVFM
uniref:Uncharacterized protein n=1 Tax=Tanacetum cinerariifolium TaxID=118510 RepID=A0A699HN14_TANCI|nr:hypothetical protein [Tanacetum cinerariifolium]